MKANINSQTITGTQSNMEASLPVGFRIAMVIIACSVAGSSNLSAAIWRVNQDSNIPADFRSPQEANDSLQVHDGDTILLSVGNYFSGFTLTKRLIVMGTGYLLVENLGSRFQAARIENITLKTGSSGSRIQSLWFTGLSVADPTDNIQIVRCRATFLTNRTSNPAPLTFGWSVFHSCIDDSITFTGPADGGDLWPHFTFTGNLLRLKGQTPFLHCSTSFNNNTIYSEATVLLYRSHLTGNMLIAQSIYLHEGSCAINNTGHDGAGNFINNDGTATEQSNSTLVSPWGVDASAIVEERNWGRPKGNSNSYLPGPDRQWGTADDIVGPPASSFGAWAGGYVNSGLPPVPVILSLDAPHSVNKDAGMPVNVTIKSQP